MPWWAWTGLRHQITICKIYWCCRNTKHWWSPLFRYETLNSWHKFFKTRRERHNFYYADCTIWPNKCAVHPVVPSWTGPAQSRISSNVFFKIAKNLSPSFLGMASITPQAHFLSGFFIMTFVIVISSAHERELYSVCVCTCTKSRIVQSITKPNDKI